MQVEIKKCPACDEEVRAEATVCRFCNFDFTTGKKSTTQKLNNQSQQNQTAKRHFGVGDGVRLGCGMFVVLPILLFIGSIILIVILAGCFRATHPLPTMPTIR